MKPDISPPDLGVIPSRESEVVGLLQEEQASAIRLLDELATHIPDQMWLTEVKEVDQKVRLVGMAINNEVIADFAKRLSSSDWFTDVYLVLIQRESIAGLPLKKFVITSKRSRVGRTGAGVLADRREIPDLLHRVASTGKEVGLEFLLYVPLAEVELGFYAEVPVKLKVEGSYQEIAVFFDHVARFNRLVTFRGLAIHSPRQQEGGAIVATMEATLLAYRSLEQGQGRGHAAGEAPPSEPIYKAVSKRDPLRPPNGIPIECDRCDDYYACIDACAAEYASNVDVCTDLYDDEVLQEPCIALADHLYETCLEACEPRPACCRAEPSEL